MEAKEYLDLLGDEAVTAGVSRIRAARGSRPVATQARNGRWRRCGRRWGMGVERCREEGLPINSFQDRGLKILPLPLKFVLGAPLFIVGFELKPMLLDMEACINANGPERTADDRGHAIELKAD